MNDCLNDRLNKKDLGAFYTPMPYCEKAAELVKMAVDRVPEGNDYIILDRCAGTGNLEEALIGLKDKNGDNLIDHCIVSTYEYYEYKVLQERIGDLVRHIIPPDENKVEYDNGRIANADALSKEYINNSTIASYINNPNCSIILFENPPYTDDSASARETGKSRGVTKGSYISKEFSKNVKSDIKGLVQSKELSNLFIWSGFNYYLRQSTDSYIVFSPIKYWKSGHLIKKNPIKGYLFNRAHFHASASAISCILWANDGETPEELNLQAIDIINNTNKDCGNIVVKKVHSVFTEKFFDKRTFKSDTEDGIWCGMDGYEAECKKSTGTKNIYNENIIAYMRLIGFSLDPIKKGLTRMTINARNNGFLVRKDNYLEKLPLWVAKMYSQDNWYETDIYNTTADGGNNYIRDKEFIKSCLIYTCLSNQNKCLSFNGSDGRKYKNELCFDVNTLASIDLNNMKLDNEEKQLLELWNNIITEAKKTKNYNSDLAYGTYQITKELNTYHEEGSGKNTQKVYDYPILNGYLITLRDKLKTYYKTHITDKMFKYELLK